MEARIKRSSNNFDFLRLFAAVTVMILHSIHHLEVPFLWYNYYNGLWFVDGVPLFFILSGMLVYRSYESHFKKGLGVKSYLANRYLRVAPALYTYLVLITISLLIVGVISIDNLVDKSFIKWFINSLLLMPFFGNPLFQSFGIGAINGSLWTISQEFSFYLVVPLIFLFERKIGIIKTIVLLLLASMLGIVLADILLHTRFNFLYIHTFVPYLTYFLLGIVWLRYWDKVPKNGFLALLTLVIYFVIRNSELVHETLGYFWTLSWIIPLSYSIIWFGYCGPKIFSKFTNKIGDISFGIYIWHMPIVNFFIHYNVTDKLGILPKSFIHILVIATTTLLAVLSWYFIEKPALRYKPYTSRPSELNGEQKSA